MRPEAGTWPANAWWGGPLVLSAKPETQSQNPPHSANRNTTSFGKQSPPPASYQRRVICPWAGFAAVLSPSLRGISKLPRLHVHPRSGLPLSSTHNKNETSSPSIQPACKPALSIALHQTGNAPHHRSRHTTLGGSQHPLDRTCIGVVLISIDLDSESCPSRSPAIHTDAANTQYERGQPLSYRHPVL